MIYAELPRLTAEELEEHQKTIHPYILRPSAEALEKWSSYVRQEYSQAENETVKKSEAMSRQVGGNHYKDKAVQPWDVVDAGPHAQAIGFYRWSALAYIMRAGDKGPAREDYEKAIHYLEKLLEIL
jgi:hypothetical protein